ncbi:MAG: type III-B CRISPR module-associated protein Cmr5 [Myxococcota bacterium]|nr:type III-B CRISPR module-associated protein Cmr5 [Myxococcota bacterium]MDW8363848.1 type III-B CRISPR module-associated protein Cmr5 [Myxococcales bacterium]
MAMDDARRKPLLRDQRRALHAYESVGKVPKAQRKDYEIALNDLGANILRSGLCAAIAAVQRLGDRGSLLLEHLASADVPGLEGAKASDLARRIRALDADGYMIATRELLQVATWLKRAVQASFEET